MEESKPFSCEYCVRWHDTDANLVCRPSAVLTYMQETANLQCREYGYDLDMLRDREKKAFILSSITMNFYSPIRVRDNITVQTWCPESPGVSAFRSFRILRGCEVVVEANSVWALVDIETHRPIKASEFAKTHEFPAGVQINPEILLPKPHIKSDVRLSLAGSRKVMFSDIDYNGHMNNTHYPDMICDFLPDMRGKRMASVSVSFRGEARFGDEIEVFTSGGNGCYLLRTMRPDGSVNIDAEAVVADL